MRGQLLLRWGAARDSLAVKHFSAVQCNALLCSLVAQCCTA